MNNDSRSFAATVNRQRIRPRIWDYSYLLLRSNLRAFMVFRDLIIKERRTAILDVGCGFKPWAAMFDPAPVRYTGVDFDQERSSADVVAPTHALPFADDSFDGLIYSEVLEHVDDLPASLMEMRRVARDNAIVYISSPFVFPLHGSPHDYQRLSRYFYARAFQDDELLLLQESNSSFSTPLLAFNLALETSPFGLLPLKYPVYLATNAAALLTDAATRLAPKAAGGKWHEGLRAMPLGYALIVRVKK